MTSSGSGSTSSSSSSSTSLGAVVRSKLRLLTVCDAENGVVLFERVWQWNLGGRPQGVGNLVRSFFQIAKQLDHGMVTRVVFEDPEVSSQQMQMVCTKNREIVVALFYDEDELLSDSAHATVYAAMRQYIEQIRELWRRQQRDEGVPEGEKGEEEAEQKNESSLFDSTIEILLARILDSLT